MNKNTFCTDWLKEGLILCFVMLLLMSCTIINTPRASSSPIPILTPRIPANEWLLDASSFPPTWERNPCEPYCNRTERPTESLRTFGIVGIPGHVIQNVFYFSSEEDAKAKFQRYEETTPYASPAEITYQSPIADEQYLRCGVDKVLGCYAGLRYHNYFVYFYFDIDSGRGEGLMMEEVEPILLALDNRASELLDIPLSTEE